MVLLKGISQRYQIIRKYILSKFGVNIKISKRILDKIDAEVSTGQYASRSELIMEAVLKHLDRSARENEIRSFLTSPEGRALLKEIQTKDEK